MTKTILVTGAAGFIGSHTARVLLEQGHAVIGLDNYNDYYAPQIKEWNITQLESDFPKQFEMIRGDILDLDLLNTIFEQKKIDKICHLAARAGVRPSIANPFLYEEVNIRGTLNLLEMAKQHGIGKFLLASTSSVYGECDEVPFREDFKLDQPISPYAASKKAAEQYAYTYSHLHGIRVVVVRFFTVYGPAGRPDMAPFLFTKGIDEGTPVKRFGDGTTSRDYTFVADIVAGVVAALEYETRYDVFNLGNNTPVQLNDFIALVEKLLGKKAMIEQHPMQPGDVSRTYADISKAQEFLNYNPQTSFEQGMERFVKWYLEHKEMYR